MGKILTTLTFLVPALIVSIVLVNKDKNIPKEKRYKKIGLLLVLYSMTMAFGILYGPLSEYTGFLTAPDIPTKLVGFILIPILFLVYGPILFGAISTIGYPYLFLYLAILFYGNKKLKTITIVIHIILALVFGFGWTLHEIGPGLFG